MATVKVRQYFNAPRLVPGVSGRTVEARVEAAFGSCFHVAATCDNGLTPTLSIASNPGLTWTSIDSFTSVAAGQKHTHWVSSPVPRPGWYTITVTYSTDVASRAMSGKEISGSMGYDGASHAAQSQSTPTTGADATTSGNTSSVTSVPALVSGFCWQLLGTAMPNAGTGFTSDGTGWVINGTIETMRAESKRITAAGVTAATYTATANNEHSTMVAVFMESPYPEWDNLNLSHVRR